VNRVVGAPVAQRVFEFLDEEAVAADGGQRAILDGVAAGGDVEDRRRNA